MSRPRKLKVLLLGISVVNIGGTTIHPGFGSKRITTLLGSNNESKATSKNRLSEVKFLIIDELFYIN